MIIYSGESSIIDLYIRSDISGLTSQIQKRSAEVEVREFLSS